MVITTPNKLRFCFCSFLIRENPHDLRRSAFSIISDSENQRQDCLIEVCRYSTERKEKAFDNSKAFRFIWLAKTLCEQIFDGVPLFAKFLQGLVDFLLSELVMFLPLSD
jgi:hypothetical protein